MTSLVRKLPTLLLKTTAFTTTSVIIGTTAYTYTENGAGLNREIRFWSKLLPVVANYYIQTSRNSPYVKLQKLTHTGLYSKDGVAIEEEEEEKKEKEELAEEEEKDEQVVKVKEKEVSIFEQRRKQLIQDLHNKHAPEILQVILDLRGLYIKLGQVLSVTALPIPQQYRDLFQTLQSNVPNSADFETVVKPTLERELIGNNNSSSVSSLEELFEYIDPIPCGAASIGQAHRARLHPTTKDTDSKNRRSGKHEREVIIKVQYPDASWQIPADIKCVGDFLQLCIYANVIDPQAAKLSYEEFSHQFLLELDYQQECSNLQTVYKSTLDPSAPYGRHNVLVPKVYKELCTDKVITMSYLPGKTMEYEAKRQLELLGIDTKKMDLRKIVQNTAKATEGSITNNEDNNTDEDGVVIPTEQNKSWKVKASNLLLQRLNIINFDTILWTVRSIKRLYLWSQGIAVISIQSIPTTLLSKNIIQWANTHHHVMEQSKRLGQIESWCRALFDVHGHQIFSLGLFNSDPHPGNILLLDTTEMENILGEEGGAEGEGTKFKSSSSSPIGLIDYGQCKQLTPQEQLKIARLILSVANNESDEVIADTFRALHIQTKNDSTTFLANFAKLMFGPFESKHLSHDWHRELHKSDGIVYFPKEISMVYRTSLLLRGLAVSLQLNYSISREWRSHALDAVKRLESLDGLQ